MLACASQCPQDETRMPPFSQTLTPVSDRHAKLETAAFFDDDGKLSDAVDFDLLQRRDFMRDPERPDKVERYQAEALAYRHVPVAVILGVGCYTSAIKGQLE